MDREQVIINLIELRFEIIITNIEVLMHERINSVHAMVIFGIILLVGILGVFAALNILLGIIYRSSCYYLKLIYLQ